MKGMESLEGYAFAAAESGGGRKKRSGERTRKCGS